MKNGFGSIINSTAIGSSFIDRSKLHHSEDIFE